VNEDLDQHHRRSIRLKGYDYTQPGAYFVTLVTRNRETLFGEIVEGEVRLNRVGMVAQREWERLSKRFPAVQIDDYVIMPNHVHGIIVITGRGTADLLTNKDLEILRRAPTKTAELLTDMDPETLRRAPTMREQFGQPVPGSIPTIIRSYKSAVTYRVNLIRNSGSAQVWQRNYYEHFVRDEAELNRIRQYISNNPLQWEMDRENPYKTG